VKIDYRNGHCTAEEARKRLDAIEDTSLKLAQFTNMGRSRDELHPGLHSFPLGKYLIYYLPISGGIEIVRVLHGMMDLDALF
jgi:toxin ParE1/3/4